MKKILSILILSSILYANENGFEFILNVPVGGNLNVNPLYELKSDSVNKYSGYIKMGFDTGVGIQLGYLHKINNSFSFSFLGNIAYSYSIVNIENPVYDSEGKDTTNPYPSLTNVVYYLDNMKIGIAPKFNHNDFSYTIGLGIILPLYIVEKRSIDNDEYLYRVERGGILPFGLYSDFSFDYSVFFTKQIALTVGAYTGIDIYGDLESIATPRSKAQFFIWNIGLKLGFRFAPDYTTS